jgi:hypothetical protein
MKDLVPAVVLGDLSASLRDFSTTGLGVRVRDLPAQLSVGSIIPLSLRLNDVPAFTSRAQVVRVDGEGRWTTLGLKFLDDFLDPVELQATYGRLFVESAVSQGASRFAALPSDYRQLCGDAAFFFEYWRSSLDRLAIVETTGRISVAAATEIEAAAEARMRNEWVDIRVRGNELTRSLDPDDPRFVAAKRYTEIQLTPHTLDGLIWKRAYEKPLGYPGDYVLMTYMYDDSRCGVTAFERILHQLGREERLAATVPSRKELLVGLIKEVVRRRRNHRASAVRLLSIGAGPAREIEEFIESGDCALPLVVSLLDQDEDALAYACERLQKVALRHGRQIDIRARHIAFGQLLSRGDLLAELRGQDMIYSAGLMDYLSDRVAQGLVTLCYQLAAPQSLLAFGNALSAPDVRWVPEFVLDWRMIYRSESEVVRFAETLPSDASISVKTDPSSAWCFVLVEKPALPGER